jgi:hypothetical protein
MFETRVPAWVIAVYVNEQGAVYSSEILDRFLISEQTLRRRRPELRRLGIEFVERGRGSFYAAPGFACRLPAASLPQRASPESVRSKANDRKSPGLDPGSSFA